MPFMISVTCPIIRNDAPAVLVLAVMLSLGRLSSRSIRRGPCSIENVAMAPIGSLASLAMIGIFLS